MRCSIHLLVTRLLAKMKRISIIKKDCSKILPEKAV